MYIPLEFWFCRNVGLALPLIALQYHEVKVNIELASLTDLSYSDSETLATTLGLDTDDFVATIATGSTAVTLSSVHATNTKLSTVSVSPTGTPISGIELWADYIYLDVEERKRFAQVSHEYLIDQLQFVGADSVSGGSVNSKLNFNHPVKELVWITKDDGVLVNQSASSVSLKLNGHDRFAARPGKYFSMVQPYQHHTCVPVVASGINVYSFALKPEEHQPSGTCNFSRIDNASLILTGLASGTTELKVFATNYNILRILSGMGGIAYSN